MPEEPGNLILHIIREIRDQQKTDGKRLERVEKRVDDLYETTYTAAGMAAHANVSHDHVSDDIAELKNGLKSLKRMLDAPR